MLANMREAQKNRAQTIVGTVGFFGGFGFVVAGAFTGNIALLIIGAAIALAGVIICITLEARGRVTHVSDPRVPAAVVSEAPASAHE